MKSASSLKLPHAEPFSRKHKSHLFKRGSLFRPFDGGDVGFFYAAYARNVAFNGIDAGLSPKEFQVSMFAKVALFREAGGEIWTVICLTPRGVIPVGMFEVNVIVQDESLAPQTYPHAFWFPEATQRNKLETWVKVLERIRASSVIIVPETQWRFFDHVCQYGALRTIGQFRGYLADGTDAKIYQGNG